MNYAGLIEPAPARRWRSLARSIPPSLVRTLSISSQQLVEIAKALTLDCRILILDEPTAALTEREARVLFDIMRKLAARGISIIYISHRMVEIFEHCDRVTVFRDGRHIVTADVAEITPDYIVNKMVGRVIGKLYPPKQSAAERLPDSAARGAGARPTAGASAMSPSSFGEGEILGIAGLIGAGRSEIVKGICGLHRRARAARSSSTGGRLPSAATATASTTASSTFPRTARATASSSICRSRPMSRRSTSTRSRPRGAPSTGESEAEQATGLGDRLGAQARQHRRARSRRFRAATSRRSRSPRCCRSIRASSSSTSRHAASMSAPRPKSTASCATSRASGVGIVVVSSELPELIGLCDRVLVVREGEISGRSRATADRGEHHAPRLVHRACDGIAGQVGGSSIERSRASHPRRAGGTDRRTRQPARRLVRAREAGLDPRHPRCSSP